MFLCPACDLVYSHPMRAAGAEWYEHAYAVRHLAVDDRIRTYFRRAVARIPPGARVLDVGCGEGVFVNFARGLGRDAYGVDRSRKSIEAGRARYGLTTLAVGEASESSGVFDAATLFEVIEHVSDPRQYLVDVSSRVRSGGLLVISTPNRDRWPVKDFVDFPPHHPTRWSLRALRELGERAGLVEVRVSTTGRAESVNLLLGYFARYALYRLLGLDRPFRGMARQHDPQPATPQRIIWRVLARWGSTLRRLRDAVLWVPSVVLAPLLLPAVHGYTLMLFGRKP
jgi:SAM-dependent methyltransferase